MTKKGNNVIGAKQAEGDAESLSRTTSNQGLAGEHVPILTSYINCCTNNPNIASNTSGFDWKANNPLDPLLPWVHEHIPPPQKKEGWRRTQLTERLPSRFSEVRGEHQPEGPPMAHRKNRNGAKDLQQNALLNILQTVNKSSKNRLV